MSGEHATFNVTRSTLSIQAMERSRNKPIQMQSETRCDTSMLAITTHYADNVQWHFTKKKKKCAQLGFEIVNGERASCISSTEETVLPNAISEGKLWRKKKNERKITYMRWQLPSLCSQLLHEFACLSNCNSIFATTAFSSQSARFWLDI